MTATPSPVRRRLLTPARGVRRPLILLLLGVALFALAFALREGGEPAWYASEGWTERTRLAVPDEQIGERLEDFPVIVDLGGLSAAFWKGVQAGCGDLRVTTSDGQTEVPRQIVSCDRGSRSGELRFLAPSLSARSDTRFYLYYANPVASDYAPDGEYGAQALAPWGESTLASAEARP